MKTLTRGELLDKFNNVIGATFATIETETEPKVRKGCPKLVKRSRINGVLGYNYQNSVNYQRVREEKEDDFESKGRVWGKRLNALVIMNGLKRYLNIKVQHCEKPEYFANGVRVDNSVAQTYLYAKSESSRQGLDKDVVVRNYDIDNIVKITMNGETYDIVS